MSDSSLTLSGAAQCRAAAWPRVLPFGAFILLLALRPTLVRHLGSWGDWVYAAQAGVAAILLGLFWPRLTELHSTAALSARNLTLAVCVGVVVFVVWINLDWPLLTLGQGTGMRPPADQLGSPDPVWLAVRLAGAALVVPLIEELFWRSLVMRWLDARNFLALPARGVSLRSAFFAALVFGLEHSLWFAGLLAGLAYAAMYRRGNLWLAVIAHAVTNLLLGIWVIQTGNWQFW